MKIDFLSVDKQPITTEGKSKKILILLIGILVIGIGFFVWQFIIREPELEPYDPILIPEPDRLVIVNIEISPKEPFLDEEITISFIAENRTDQIIEQDVDMIKELIIAEKLGEYRVLYTYTFNIVLDPGISKEFSHTLKVEEKGRSRIRILDQSMEFEVISERRQVYLEIKAIEIPEQVFVANEEISVIIAVTNSFEKDLTETIEIIIGEEKHFFEATVSAQTTEIFVYKIPLANIGFFTVIVDDYEKVVQVVKAEPEPEPEPQPIPELDELAIIQLREQLIMDLIEKASLSFVAIETQTTLGTIAGSGFIVSSDGLVLTNRHVALPPRRQVLGYNIYIYIEDQEIEFSAELVDYDPFQDLAILQIQPLEGQEISFPFFTLGDSDLLRPGQTVIFIGNLLGRFPKSVNKGIVGYLDRDVFARDDFHEITKLNNSIQITADVNHGNSGGPLLNLEKQVVGIITAKGGNGRGIGFALPSNALKPALQDTKKYGEIIHPFLGVTYEDLGLTFVRENNHQGFLIIAITPNSPAHNILRQNDIVIEINNQIVDSRFSLGEAIRKYNPGDKIDLTILRNNERMIIEDIILEKRED